MSQKKVDAYKARKGLHNKTDRKEKVLFGLEMFAWAFICVVIVAWIGYSAYVKVTGAKENVVQNTVMDTTALDNYISNLSTDASDGTDSTDADTAEEEDTTASTDTDSEDADAADTTADDSETETADKSEEVAAIIPTALLLLRQALDFTYREELLMNSFSDYVEHARTWVEEVPVPEKADEAVKEEIVEHIADSIRQTAAAGSHFSGMLTPEEDEIMREIIREFMK